AHGRAVQVICDGSHVAAYHVGIQHAASDPRAWAEASVVVDAFAAHAVLQSFRAVILSVVTPVSGRSTKSDGCMRGVLRAILVLTRMIRCAHHAQHLGSAGA